MKLSILFLMLSSCAGTCSLGDNGTLTITKEDDGGTLVKKEKLPLEFDIIKYRVCSDDVEKTIFDFCKEDYCKKPNIACFCGNEKDCDPKNIVSYHRDPKCEEKLREEKHCLIKYRLIVIDLNGYSGVYTIDLDPVH